MEMAGSRGGAGGREGSGQVLPEEVKRAGRSWEGSKNRKVRKACKEVQMGLGC